MKVTVTITDCPARDARAVLAVLAAGFPSSDRGPGDVPQETPGAGPTVWTSVFDVPEVPEKDAAAPEPLSGPVTVTVQGAPRETALALDLLRGAFTVHDEGTAAGDQEQEVRVRVADR
ncbi:hypothetical protein ACFYVL_32545 [Streptomyces sp. NPDC004111]|uniref:hypothetical protein n=1 Tax=Streptomyces sp. NPDC004111 TaxID=3364690 RepID=UPI0036ADF0BF